MTRPKPKIVREVLQAWRNASLAVKSSVIVMLAFTTLVPLGVSHHLEREERILGDHANHTIATLTTGYHLITTLYETEIAAQAYVNKGETDSKMQFEAALQRTLSSLAELSTSSMTGQDQHQAFRLEVLNTALPDYLAKLSDAALRRRIAPEQVQIDAKNIRSVLDAFIAQEVLTLGQHRTVHHTFTERRSNAILISVLGSLTLTLLATVLFTRSLGTRLRRIEENARRLANREALLHVPPSRDEIGRLQLALERTQKYLSSQAQRLDLTLESGGILLWDMNLATDEIRFAQRPSDESIFASLHLPESISAWLDTVHQDDRSHVQQVLAATHHHNSECEVSFRVITSSGSVRWLVMHGRSETPREGEAHAEMFGVLFDRTDSKHAEHLLQASEQKYRSVVTHLKSVIFQMDTEGHFTFLNPAWTELTGHPVHESLRVTSLRFLHPDDHERTREMILELSSKATSHVRYELRLITRDGTDKWVEVFAHPLFDEDGSLAGVGGTFTDVTEQKRANERLSRQQEFYEGILNRIPVEIAVLDHNLRYLYCNPTAIGNAELRAWVIGKNDFEYCHYRQRDPSFAERRVARMRDAIREQRAMHWEESMITPSGAVKHHYRSTHPVLSSTGQLEMMIGYSLDITARKHAEEEKLKFVSLVENSSDFISMSDLDGRTFYINAAGRAMIGLSEGHLPDDLRITDCFTDETRSVLGERIEQSIHALEPWGGEGQLRHVRTSDVIDVQTQGFVVRAARSGDALCIATVQRDIRERKQAQRALQAAHDELELRVVERTEELVRLNEQLQHDAFHDSLTGMPNRALFSDRLAQAIYRAGRQARYQFAVLFLDFDRFKVVNDSLGHAAGDALLIDIGERLQATIRQGDTAARLGGDEFVILLEDVTSAEAAVVTAERVQQAFHEPFVLSGQLVRSTVSIGIVYSDLGYSNPDDVMRDADIAMYRAKQTGKARHVLFDVTMRESAVKLMRLESDLRSALERQEFEVNYQPIIELGDSRVAGFEALIRWHHPTLGLIPPLDFIPLAEETGMIIDIDRWVLHEACRQVQAWQEEFGSQAPLTVSVNLSSQQFLRADLPSYIQQVLSAAGLPCERLKLEITESLLMDDSAQVKAVLDALRAMQVQLHIDDFGTGYSSLSYLHRFDANTLKIDRAFVGRMTESTDSAELVRTIVAMAHTLGMQVVAEGVETSEQAEQLHALTCEFAQGYFFSRPLAAPAAAELLRRARAGEPLNA